MTGPLATARPIVSWHPVLTDHQSHTLEALREAARVPVTVIVAKREDAARKAQGWTVAQAGTLRVRVLEGGVAAIARTLDEHRDAVHLFGSPFDQPRFMLALAMALWRGLPVYLISEPYSPAAVGYQDDRRRLLAWMKAKLRPAVYAAYGRLMSGRLRGVFAISPLAVAQYRAIGIPAARIHPFGYFVPGVQREAASAHGVSRTRVGCRAVFVGTLISRKGVAELVDAARRLRAAGVDLAVDVYGAGDPAAFAFDGDAIRYAGRIPFGQSPAVIAGYDVLVLPSRYDGWGVVVNEALQAGVPVVCSDRVGAGAVVRRWGCGICYDAAAPEGLESALRTMATDPALRERMREACGEARKRLDPAVAAHYMNAVIGAPPIVAVAPTANPWYDV